MSYRSTIPHHYCFINFFSFFFSQPKSGRIDSPAETPKNIKLDRFAPRDNPFYNKSMRLALQRSPFVADPLIPAFTAAEKQLADNGGSSNRPIVSVDWIRNQLANPETADKIQFIDCSWRLSTPEGSLTPHEEYLEKHIPGAIFFSVDDVSEKDASKPHRVPSDKTFSIKASEAGISPFFRHVLYDSSGMLGAARALWTFQMMGFHDAVILDGGLPAWIAAGEPVESGPIPNAIGSVDAFSGKRTTLTKVRDVEENMFSKDALVLDARSPGRFNGTEPEPREGYESGHIPGSINIPYGQLIAPCPVSGGMKLRSFPELMGLFNEKGVPLENPELNIIASCGSGMTASTLYLALRTAGFRNVKLYDGSWMEWAKPGAGRPIAKEGHFTPFINKHYFPFTESE